MILVRSNEEHYTILVDGLLRGKPTDFSGPVQVSSLYSPITQQQLATLLQRE